MSIKKENIDDTKVPSTELRKRRKNIIELGPFSFIKPIPGYQLRLVLSDDPKKFGRITKFQEDLAYDTVRPEEIGLESDLSIVTVPAGGGKNYILMKTPIEEFAEGQSDKVKATEANLKQRTKSNGKADSTIFELSATT